LTGYFFEYGSKFLLKDNEYIVRNDKDEDIEIENLSYKKIEIWRKTQLIREWEQGNLIFRVQEKEQEEIVQKYQSIEFEMFPEDLKNEAKRRYSILKPVIKGEVSTNEINEYLNSLPEKVGKSAFYDWKKRWDSHQDIRFLIPRYPDRGRKGFVTDEKVLKIIDDVVNEKIYNGVKTTTIQIFSEVELRIEEENEFRDNEDKLPSTSRSTVNRRRNKIKDMYKLNEKKYGPVQAKLMLKGSMNEVIVTKPLERVEIDWTPIDLMIIHPVTLKPTRPNLIYGIDKFTGDPIGFYVSFNEVNSEALKQYLLNIIMPKTYVKELYPFVEGDWSAYGIPRTIVLDNAKVNESLDITDACLQLGIKDIQYAGVGAGHHKGTVERGLQTLNTKFFHGTSGTTFSNIMERAYYNSEGNAYITMQGLIAMLHIVFVDLVANEYDTKRGNSPENLWKQGMQANPHLKAPLTRTRDELKLILMSGIEQRKIVNKGVVIQNEYYQSVELMKLRNAFEKEGREKETVRVRFDLNDMREVFVYNPFEQRYIKAFPTSLERKGITTEYPVHIYDLEYESSVKNQTKKQFDVKRIGRAYRTLDHLKNQEKIKVRRWRNKKKNQSEDSNNDVANGLLDVSSIGISHVQLETPEGHETLRILSEDETKKTKGKKKGNKKKKETVEAFDGLRVTYDVDIDELPKYNTSHQGVDSKNE
jgi:putative transposase